MPNRLSGETSPYLLQHAGNPVDWYPWGDEALAKARRENKLIFLSIGYAACHWCHVMEHESFEDDSVAAILNQDFISIKVDREERPDLDEIYMAATMLFSGGHGGWPMSVFLAPDQKPVFAGTYFPKDDAYGRPGFKTVLRFLQQKWQTEEATLVRDAGKVADSLSQILGERTGSDQLPGVEHIEQAAAAIYRAFDHARGGMASGTNKFPQTLSQELLLRAFRAGGQERYREVVELTLERISLGGIYDHLGGGLHRYATDPNWLVPHFEKMLYDQALVVSVLVDAYQSTQHAAKKELFESRIRGICDYVLRDLSSPDGAFYSSEDADSEGKEGKFYIWTREQINDALGESDGRLFASHYDVSDHGNWTHPGDAHVPSGPKNVLQVVRSAEVLAKLDSVPVADVEASLARSRERLFRLREQRIRPGLDDKVLTGWNGLMIGALARAAAVLDEPRYGEAATRAADFALERIRSGDRLLATYGRGQARLRAYSTDYAFLIEGLLVLYEWNGEPRYLFDAEHLTETLIEHYWDREDGGFFLTAQDHEDLLLRSKTLQDGATPSSNSVMALCLQKLAILLGRPDHRDKAGAILRLFVDSSQRMVFQQERLLCALDAWHQGWDEVAIVGSRQDERTRALLARVHAQFRPNKVVVVADRAGMPGSERIPLLAGRGIIDNRPTAYVCRDYVCERPVVDPEELFTGI